MREKGNTKRVRDKAVKKEREKRRVKEREKKDQNELR